MYIDVHTHCRDFEQNYKETIAHALDVAKDSGLSAIFDMPNTKPPMTNREKVLERLALARNANSPVFYGLYVGLTSNPNQIKEVVELYREFFPQKSSDKTGVIGLKMFAGKSVGDLEIINSEDQLNVYEQLVKNNYQGVLAVHCEKESEMITELWDPKFPESHTWARPEEAEIESIKDQINFAVKTNYGKIGKLHIPHISTSQGVELVNSVRSSINISCGATPHHLLLNSEEVYDKGGVLYKVNPPIRTITTQEALLEKFKNGEIDILETDHAPHTLEEKLQQYMSGIPELASWPIFLKILKEKGVSKELIEKVAFENPNEIFGTKIQKINYPVKSRVGEYSFEPFNDY